MSPRTLALAGLLAAALAPAARGQYPSSDPRFFPPGRGGLPELSDSLVGEARQAADNVRYELAGSRLAVKAGMRADALTRSAAAFQDRARRGGPDLPAAFVDVDRAYTALAGVLGSGDAVAPRTSHSLDRIQRISYQVRNLIGAYDPGSPGLPQNPGPRWDAAGVGAATSNLQIAADRANQMLAGRRDPGGVAASAAASQLVQQNRYFQGMQNSSVRAEDLWQMVQQLRLVSWDMFQYAATAPVDPPTRDAIVVVKRQLDGLCGLFAINPLGPIEDPNLPPGSNRVVKAAPPDPAAGPPPGFIPPPVVEPPPFRPGFRPRPPRGPWVGREFVEALRAATAQLDGYIQTLGVHANQVKQGRQFLSEAQKLRDTLTGLGQRVESGSPRDETRGALDQALRRSGEISARMNAIVGFGGGPMVAQFRAAEQSIQQMNRLLP